MDFSINTGGQRRERELKARLTRLVKRWIWEIREREYDCCGQKIQYFLSLEHNIHLSVPKIYEILAEKYVIRSKWEKNKARGAIARHIRLRLPIITDIDSGGLGGLNRESDKNTVINH